MLTPDECTPTALSKSEESLVASLPLDILMEVNVPALVLLRKRIQTLSVLPPGTVQYMLLLHAPRLKLYIFSFIILRMV